MQEILKTQRRVAQAGRSPPADSFTNADAPIASSVPLVSQVAARAVARV